MKLHFPSRFVISAPGNGSSSSVNSQEPCWRGLLVAGSPQRGAGDQSSAPDSAACLREGDVSQGFVFPV